MEITVKVNGADRTADVEPRLLLAHLIREDSRGAHNFGRRALPVDHRETATEYRELLEHRRFFRRVGSHSSSEVPNRRRAILRYSSARISLRAREPMEAMRDQKPHRVGAPEIHPIRVPAQISAVRLERRLER